MRTGKTVAVIQAHMGSERLPGKVMLPLCGRPMIARLLYRASHPALLDEVWVAATSSPKDDELCKFLQKENFKVYRGSEDDVLSSYVETARKSEADFIVRLTGDCPLIDPDLIDDVIEAFLKSDYDYMKPLHEDGTIRGLDTEIFTLDALMRADAMANDAPSREHVTLYMYRNPEQFSVGVFPFPERLKLPGARLCVDEENDFKLISTIYEELYIEGKLIPIADVLELLRQQPELLQINSEVHQKTLM